MFDSKRSSNELTIVNNSSSSLMKRSKNESSNALISQEISRSSKLLSPNMQLMGHKSEILSSKFSPNGNYIASGSFDKTIFLWNVYGNCENYNVLQGHKNAIIDIQWSYDTIYIFSASADKTAGYWDAEIGQRVRKLVGHTAPVNSCSTTATSSTIATSSDDLTIKIWDVRVKGYQHSIKNTYQNLAVCFGNSPDVLFSGGIENDIKSWDLRKTESPTMLLKGHTDAVTGLKLSPDGNYLLSNSMDCTVRAWDTKPFVATDRNIKIFEGIQHNFEKHLHRCTWSPNGSMLAAGSSDRTVTIWDFESKNILYKLPGHQGAVIEVDFHPKEPIILSCSTDSTIFVGEIDASFAPSEE
eukprot:TRINITY_DN3970_c0_g3_i1.p1 TRINITY_DN3970_c0_g3~~TRINITY_DN3970_c0_g3_i1.p1  ORF type:complete len:355 (+),score=137.88 TRINITY_DN3970_c0_g3_i1:129-1193(+)